jgi:hypothetical protein
VSKDAYRVTLDQVREAFKILGFDPDLSTLRELRMEPGQITIERARLNEEGRQFVVGYHDVATETVTVAVVGK